MPFNEKLQKTQKRLINLGYPVGEAGADGYYGDDTDNAINAALDYEFGSQNDEQADSSLPDEYITEDFQWWEFKCRDGTEVPEDLKTNTSLLCKETLQPMRKELGAPIDIISGYRTPEYTDDVVYNDGKHHESMHATGGAADIFARSKHEQLGLMCIERYHDSQIGGLGLDLSYIHVDRRDVISYVNNRWIDWYCDFSKLYPSWQNLLKQYGYV